MSLTTRISALALSIATEIKAVRATIGSTVNLTTRVRNDLVSSLNGLQTDLTALSAGAAGISDTTTGTTTTWSSSKTNTAINAAVAALVNGAPTTMDTLKELSDALAGENDQITAILTSLGNRLRVDAAQGLTAGQQLQGRQNLDVYSTAEIGDVNTDFAAAFTQGLL